ncbi:hypothetical protein AB4Y40_00605 [Paraburkholderia sp. EG287B]|uniref:hypothetical protein n=1 Tax=Paraburkholderia sp. EG287B TaxID=3237010 RepID=UPI0034D391EA
MTIQAVSSQPAVAIAANTGAQNQQATAATQPASKTQAQSSTTTTQASTPSASYAVTISNAARAALAEATETSVQTSQEANRGDRQAQRLLAKEQANKLG